MPKLQSGKSIALLIGCNYPNKRLLGWHELSGCYNDVNAMQATLIGVFGFDQNNIEVLMDKEGTQDEAMPTGAKIKSTLERLISQLQEGDVLFFHFSGHGTRFPFHKVSNEMVEAIVPCDGNFITSMDFRVLVDHVPQGATFVFCSDSCNSGGLIDKEKVQIGPNTSFMGIPVQSNHIKDRFINHETVLAALQPMARAPDMPNDVENIMLGVFRTQASVLFRHDRGWLPQPLKPDQGILLSACQSDEFANECTTNEGTFGAFTATIQVICKEKLLSQPFSYKKIVMKAREILPARILQYGRDKQHPCLYCSDNNVNRTFLANA